MAIYAGFAALSLYAFVTAADRIRDEATKQVGDKALEQIEAQSETMVGQALETTGWGTRGDAAEMMRDNVPLIVIFFFAVASYFLPMLVALVSFDQFSELSTRGARFVLLRVRRGTYVAGKACASIGTVAVFLLIMWTVVAGVAVYRGGNSAPVIVRESLRAWALMTVLALPYLSITALISCFVRPGLAFVLTLGAWIAMWIGFGLVNSFIPWLLTGRGWTDAAEAERHLLAVFPWHHAPKLISRDFGTLAAGVGPLIPLAVIGYLLTFFVVRKRDV
jgi:ABC-type transport system involved in multi-copper enzyme maturation permease subunit